MRSRSYLFAMNGGEVSPLALGRVDLVRMRLAAEVMTNCVPRVIGPMSARPGLAYLSSTHADGVARNIPFVFSARDTALIELTDRRLRVRVDGVLVARPAVSTVVSNGDFTSAAGWTTTTTGTGVATINTGEQRLQLRTPARGDTAQAGQSGSVAVSDRNVEHGIEITVAAGPVRFRCGSTEAGDDLIAETDLDTGFHSLAFTPTGGTWHIMFAVESEAERVVSRVAIAAPGTMQIAAPWAAADLFRLRHDQSGDVIYVVASNRAYRPHIIERRGLRSWSLVEYEFRDGPFLGKTANVTLDPGVLTGNGPLRASADFFQPGHVGAVFRLSSPATAIVKALTAEDRWTDTIRVSGNSRYDIDQDGNNENTDERNVSLVISGTWSGTVTIQIADSEEGPWRPFDHYSSNTSRTIRPGVANSVAYVRAGFTGGNYNSGVCQIVMLYLGGGGDGYCRIRSVTSPTEAHIEVTRRIHSANTVSEWSEGLFSGVRGWPSAVGLFEGRLWWGSRDKIVGSVSDGFRSFDLDVAGDSGPIIRSIATGAVDSIKWILGLARLCMGTSAAEPVARSSSFDEPMTPANFSIKDASTQGSADVQAIKLDRSGMFVQRSGKRAYELSFAIDAHDYAATEVTRYHPTVLEAGVRLMAVQRQPDTRVWFVLEDGRCAVLVHDRSEDVLSWFTFETHGQIEDVAVLPNTGDDDVYMIVKRTVGGTTRRFVEKLTYDSQARGGLANRMADSHVITSLMASDTVTGLSHLEGETVVAWADGKAVMTGDAPQTFTVVAGQITLPSAVTGPVIVGLSYDWRWKSAKLAYGVNDGAALSRPKTIRNIAPILYKTHVRGIRAGQTFDAMDDLPLSYKGETLDPNTLLEDYDSQSTCIPGGWDTDARLCLAGQAPLPCTVLGVSLTVDAN